jgi:3,5-epimerase/4-reductase
MANLVVGDGSAFTAAISNALSGSVLLQPKNETNLNWFNSNTTKIFYGNSSNEKLVSSILENQEIESIIYISSKENSENIVEFARNQLHGITHFLDGWRKSKSPETKTFIFLSSLEVYGVGKEEENDMPHTARLKPITSFGAALAGVEAMLHSYAVSYRLNIKILRLQSELTKIHFGKILQAIDLLSQHKEGPAEIFHLPSDSAADFSNDYVSKLLNLPGWKDSVEEKDLMKEISAKKEFKPAARFLIFGVKGWIGGQFLRELEKRKIEVIAASTRPGKDSDKIVAEEITKISPSHVVSMLGRTHGPGCGNIEYLEGGSDKLQENVKDNLYAPWSLANLCEKFDLHFTYLGTGCLFEYNPEHSRDGEGYTESDTPTFIGNKYSVVKGFTDQNMNFFKNTLNARIRLPINDEDSPRNLLRKLIGFNKVLDIPNSITYLPNCLPILADLALKKETGALNLVNPGAIAFPKILNIYEEETGQRLNFEIESVPKDSPALKTRAHCTLDTSRLQSLAPTVIPIEKAIRKASENLATHLS